MLSSDCCPNAGCCYLNGGSWYPSDGSEHLHSGFECPYVGFEVLRGGSECLTTDFETPSGNSEYQSGHVVVLDDVKEVERVGGKLVEGTQGPRFVGREWRDWVGSRGHHWRLEGEGLRRGGIATGTEFLCGLGGMKYENVSKSEVECGYDL